MSATRATLKKAAFWDEAKRELVRCDRVMRRVIPRYHGDCLSSRGDPFVTLARSIVGQQISVQAAQAVWSRLTALTPDFTPEKVSRMRTEKLRSCGLSVRKAEYIQDLAAHFRQGGMHLEDWHSFDELDARKCKLA